MHPVLFKLGPLTLHMYGLMIALGFITAAFFIQRIAQQELKIQANLLSELSIWAFLWGLIGTRILHIIMFPATYSLSDPIGWVALWRGGLVFQGAIPFSFGYAAWTLHRHKIPFWKMADIAIPFVALAQAFGRVGCFMNGCCFGRRADELFCALRFPQGSPVFLSHLLKYPELQPSDAWSFPVHPTQLYSVLGLVGICLLLLALRKGFPSQTGLVMPGYLMLYGIFRFVIEMFRDDGNPTALGAGVFSNQQIFCMAMGIAGLAILIWRLRVNRMKEAAE